MKAENKNFDETQKLTQSIMDNVIKGFEVEGDLHQMKLQIHPLISNFTYQRDKDILEVERFETLVTLARTVTDDKLLKELINALKYKITI